MSFPRTDLGGIKVSRLVAGSNWFLGYSHQTVARTNFLTAMQTRRKIADVLCVYLKAGVNLVMGPFSTLFFESLDLAQQRTGRKFHIICTPNLELTAQGLDVSGTAKSFDLCAKAGVRFCWPHTSSVDRLYDGLSRTIRHGPEFCAMIRQRGMIPGLSTHMPEVIVAADRQGLDVCSYVSIYNSAGFLMNVEIDWVQKVIHNARHPVTCIKPMAAGRVMPYVGLPFVWSTLRDCDLVTVGPMTPDEAQECIEISLAALERRPARRQLQSTRSKQSLK
jgi:hypothetical protein